MPVHFLPCFIYILAQRPNQPAVRVEPLIHNHTKSLARETAQNDLELEAVSAFELYAYTISFQTFVLVNPKQVDKYWTEAEFHSVDRVLGECIRW